MRISIHMVTLLGWVVEGTTLAPHDYVDLAHVHERTHEMLASFRYLIWSQSEAFEHSHYLVRRFASIDFGRSASDETEQVG